MATRVGMAKSEKCRWFDFDGSCLGNGFKNSYRSPFHEFYYTTYRDRQGFFEKPHRSMIIKLSIYISNSCNCRPHDCLCRFTIVSSDRASATWFLQDCRPQPPKLCLCEWYSGSRSRPSHQKSSRNGFGANTYHLWLRLRWADCPRRWPTQVHELGTSSGSDR